MTAKRIKTCGGWILARDKSEIIGHTLAHGANTAKVVGGIFDAVNIGKLCKGGNGVDCHLYNAAAGDVV